MQNYSSQLGGNTEAMEGLRQGTIEITELALTAISAYSDIWSTFSLPYLWDSGKEAVETIGSNSVMEVLEADVEANGMMIIGWMNLGSRSILNTKRPIYTPDDMKGLTIRVIEDPILVDSIIAMGDFQVIIDAGVEVNEVDKTAFYDATESVRADFVKNGNKAQANLFEVLMAAKS